MNIECPNDLLQFLKDENVIQDSDEPLIQVLEGGVSNRTVLVAVPNGQSIVFKQALEKLRVKADWYSLPQRIHREAEGLRWLTRIIPGHVPDFVIENHEHHIFGMTAISHPHDNWKNLLLDGNVNEDHVRSFGQLLGQIHNAVVVYPDIAEAFSDRSFFESLRIEPYYSFTIEQVPEVEQYLQDLICATRERRTALVHGDYSPKNVLIHQDRLYILDHEVIHFGDPAFDVGFALTHFMSKAHFLPQHRDAFLTSALSFWSTYKGEISKMHLVQDLEYYSVRHTLACMLARVCGRSPLEYLTKTHRVRQKEMVIKLFKKPPSSIEELVAKVRYELGAN